MRALGRARGLSPPPGPAPATSRRRPAAVPPAEA